MTDFTNLAALVAQGQALLDEIKGGKLAQIDASFLQKLADVDVALAAKIAQANADIANAVAPIDGKIPHLPLTKNPALIISSGTVPDDVKTTADSTFSVVAFINRALSNRSAGELALLGEIESDVKEIFADFDIRLNTDYFKAFNVIKIDWDFGVDFVVGETIFGLEGFEGEDYSLLKSNETTSQVLVKLVSGSVDTNDLLTGAEVNKWRYCNKQKFIDSFGGFTYSAAKATSQTGSLLIALPSVVTGLVSHPKHIHF